MKRRKRVLVVDDEASNRELLEALLTSLGHDVDMVADGSAALAKLDPSHDLVLLDVMMPGIDGFETARRIRKESSFPDIPICMVTVLSDKEERLRAVEAGANDFISKPVDKTELRVRTASLLRAKEAQDTIKRYLARLEAGIAELRQSLERTKKAREKTHEAHLETIERLAIAAEHRDHDSAYHVRRMSHYCELIARKLNLPAAEYEVILHGSSMHDIGKIGIVDRILFKKGKLGEEERDIMKRHPLIGARILGDATSELLRAGGVFALAHHEKWDGSGYPHGRAGENIPLWGRIAAIADVFDALTSRRHYKEPFPNDEAFRIMHEGRGTHFDPKLLDLFLGSTDEIEAIQDKYRDPAIKPLPGETMSPRIPAPAKPR